MPPLVGIAAFWPTFAAGGWRRARLPAALSPVFVTALLIGGVLLATGTSVGQLQRLGSPLHLLLGPAFVALGVRVHDHRRILVAAARPLALAVVVGTATGVVSAIALACARARALGLAPLLAAATVTRTVGTPFAVLVQTRTGVLVALAAGLAVATGVIGAILLPPLLNLLRLRDPAAVGTAAGVAAHLVGPDAVGRHHAVAGTFAGAASPGPAASSRWSCRRCGYG